MTGYLLTLSLLFSFLSGNALAAYHCTGEWFYKYATGFFGLSWVILTIYFINKGI